MEAKKLCEILKFDERKFLLYLKYTDNPVELSLETIDDIKEYIKNSGRTFNFLSFCREFNVVPFDESLVPRKCENCSYLMEGIDTDDYFCGENYVSLDDVCFYHAFNASKVIDDYFGGNSR